MLYHAWTIGSYHLTNGQHETSYMYMYSNCSEAVTGRLCASIFVLSCTVRSWLFNNHAYQCASSQTTSITSWKSTRPSRFFSCTLKNMGRPGYEASYFVQFTAIRGYVFVRYPEFRGCPYLRGWKCISSMVKSIGSMWFVRYYRGCPLLGGSVIGSSTVCTNQNW